MFGSNTPALSCVQSASWERFAHWVHLSIPCSFGSRVFAMFPPVELLSPFVIIRALSVMAVKPCKCPFSCPVFPH